MRYRKFILRIFLYFLCITLIALTVITWYATTTARNFYIDETIKKIKTEAVLLTQSLKTSLINKDHAYVKNIISELDTTIQSRITVILPDGLVIADTDKNYNVMENHSKRPEVVDAFSGKQGFATRYSSTLRQTLIYVALPVYHNDKIIAVIRTAIPITSIEQTLSSIRTHIIIAGLIIALITASIGYLISRQISVPIEEISKTITRFASGNFEHHLSKRTIKEFRVLTTALNQMAQQLDEKIKTVDQQKNQQQAVFQSMAEGVLAIDQDQQLITYNNAALHLLGIEETVGKSKKIYEIIRNNQLQKIIADTFKSTELIEDEIIINHNGEHYVQVHGTQLSSSDGMINGALIVLNDVTKLRRLEQVRKDFVANVSHEIRTPLTSIKGFVEALNDGAINDKKTARRFLDIIIKQTNRLNLIIGDLLALANLEEHEKRASIQFEEANLYEIIQDALKICQPDAKGKHIDIKLNCPADISCYMNSSLVEQALVNLISNSIKYSPEKTVIEINYTRDENDHIVEVKDQGIGISKEHIERIFERFYRVDKARSRKLGGTGLGLAIVKHIAKVHNGKIKAISKLGNGASFFLHLPLSYDK